MFSIAKKYDEVLHQHNIIKFIYYYYYIETISRWLYYVPTHFIKLLNERVNIENLNHLIYTCANLNRDIICTHVI